MKKKNNTYLNFNNGYLECYICGAWFDFNGKILPASISFASGVMDAFNKEHTHSYKQTERGKKLEQAAAELNQHVRQIMAENAWTQADIDAGKGQAVLPGRIKEFMRQSGTWSIYSALRE